MKFSKTIRILSLTGEGLLFLAFVFILFDSLTSVMVYLALPLFMISFVLFGTIQILKLKVFKNTLIKEKEELLMELNKENNDAEYILSNNPYNDDVKKKNNAIITRKIIFGTINFIGALVCAILFILMLI